MLPEFPGAFRVILSTCPTCRNARQGPEQAKNKLSSLFSENAQSYFSVPQSEFSNIQMTSTEN